MVGLDRCGSRVRYSSANPRPMVKGGPPPKRCCFGLDMNLALAGPHTFRMLLDSRPGGYPPPMEGRRWVGGCGR